MKAILEWQYDQLIKELILLQEHMADPHCPCERAGEMCVRKHLMTIEAYAQETMSIEEDPPWREKLKQLSLEAKALRATEEKALCEGSEGVDALDWSRLWRKAFEAYSLGCDYGEGKVEEEGEHCPVHP